MSKIQTRNSYPLSWILLLALLTALGPLSIDMYLPALPVMAKDFNVSTQMISNTLPAYFMGLALGQLIYGPVSDKIGRKKPLYFGLSLYVIASILCIFSQNEWNLIIARILQALGGCVGVVIARAAIRDRLDTQSAAQAFASMMIVMGIAPILAPMIGAGILSFFSWKAVFFTLVIVGLICLVCVHFFFEETLPINKRLHLNTSQVCNLYIRIFKDKSFRKPMLAGCFSGAALFCYISSTAEILMNIYQFSQQQFAIAFGMNALGITVFSALNKKVAQRFSILQRLKIGGMIQCIGAVILLITGLMPQAALILVMLGMFLAISGIGFTGPNAMALAMSKQGTRAGTASAIMGSMQFACGLLGGLLLNILVWNPIFNMGLLMLLFIGIGLWAMLTIQHE